MGDFEHYLDILGNVQRFGKALSSASSPPGRCPVSVRVRSALPILAVLFAGPVLHAQSFATTEGTWLSVDVSPNGRTIIFDLLGDIYTIPAAGGPAYRLLGGRSFESQPRYSPDGSRIVYISDRDGADNVWIANHDGSAPQQLSHERIVTMFSPEWMPDGKSIVVSATDRDGVVEVARYALEGGPATKFGQRSRTPASLLVSASYPGAYGPVPTADGGSLYYTMVEPRQHRSVDGPRAFIIRLDLATGKEHRVTFRVTNAMKPVLSPDGRLFVYATQHEGTTALRVLELATGTDRWLRFPLQRDELEARASRDVLPNYSFTPDGAALIIGFGGKIHRVTVATGADAVIPFSVEVSLDFPKRLAFPGRVPDGPVRARILQHPTLSPDGRRLAFSAFGEIYLQDLPNGRPRRLTSTPSAREFEPAWSPDGQWLGFVTWTAAGGGKIWKARADGTGPAEPLTSQPAFYTQPAWSPDGSRIVALRTSRQSRLAATGPIPGPTPDAELISVPSAGGPVTRIVDAQGMTWPHFSSEPARIYATAPGEGLVSFGLDGSDRRSHVQVVAGLRIGPMVPADQIRISPDGRAALALVNAQLYWVELPVAPAAPVRIDVRDPNGSAVRLTTLGADDFGWADAGRAAMWSVGASVARRPVPERATDSLRPMAEFDVTVEKPRSVPAGSVVLRGATVITMARPEPLANADVVVTNNRIVQVGSWGQVPLPTGARIVDVKGKFIIPGLIDIHAHWDIRRGVLDTDNSSALANLAYGVTTIRDPQSFSSDIFAYGDLVETGDMIGPRIFSTGRGLFFLDFRSLDEVRTTLTKYRDKYRTNLIKSYMVGNREQRGWVAEASRELGMMPTTEGGADFKMDLTHAMDGFSGNEHALPTAPIYDDVVQLFGRTGITYTPTLLVAFGGPFAQFDFFSREDVYGNPKLRRFIPIDVLYPRASKRLAWNHELEYHYPAVAAGAAAIRRAGGHVGLGGHGELEGLGNHWEMWALAKGGMTPAEVLRVATVNGAEAIGMTADLGSIEVGKLADLVVLDQNPLSNIRNTTSIRYVMKNGFLYRGETLDQIWPNLVPFPARWWATERP